MDNSRSYKRLSEGEPSGSAKRPIVDGNVAGGLASGPAGRRETLFRPLPDLQTRSSDHDSSPNQAKPAELDLALRLALLQRDAAGPSALVAHDLLTQLDQVPWEQPMQSQRHAVHDQADLSNTELSSNVIWEIPAGLTFEDAYRDYEGYQGGTAGPSPIKSTAYLNQPGEPSRDVIWEIPAEDPQLLDALLAGYESHQGGTDLSTARHKLKNDKSQLTDADMDTIWAHGTRDNKRSLVRWKVREGKALDPEQKELYDKAKAYNVKYIKNLSELRNRDRKGKRLTDEEKEKLVSIRKRNRQHQEACRRKRKEAKSSTQDA